MNRKLSATILCLVVAVLGLVVSLQRNHQDYRNYQTLQPSTSYPSLHHQSVSVDEAFKIVTDRTIQEKQRVFGLNLPVAEKIRRIDAVEGAGEDMIKQLQQAHFKEPFDKEAFEEDIQRRIASK